MPIEPAHLVQPDQTLQPGDAAPAVTFAEASPAREQPAAIGGPLDGRDEVTVKLKPRHLEWLRARAAAHGEPVELHAAGLLAAAWQNDEWRHANQPGMTRPGAAAPRVG